MKSILDDGDALRAGGHTDDRIHSKNEACDVTHVGATQRSPRPELGHDRHPTLPASCLR